VARIGGFLHVLNAADPVLSNQATASAQNAIVQKPVSGSYYNLDKKR
jgi:hypothetical protein